MTKIEIVAVAVVASLQLNEMNENYIGIDLVVIAQNFRKTIAHTIIIIHFQRFGFTIAINNFVS